MPAMQGDGEIAGTAIQAGDRVLLAGGAANRDPAKFPDAGVADFTRPNARDHIAFGAGVHTCIGQFLARVELQAALRAVLQRIPDFEVDGDAVVTGLTGGGHHHGVEHLPARFTPR